MTCIILCILETSAFMILLLEESAIVDLKRSKNHDYAYLQRYHTS